MYSCIRLWSNIERSLNQYTTRLLFIRVFTGNLNNALKSTRMVKTVKSLTDLEEDLTSAGSILVVVYFHAEWNRDCHTITHEIKELEADYSDVLFLKADVDEAEDVAGKYEIYDMPTFKFFRYGTLINELTGANKAQLKHFVDTLR